MSGPDEPREPRGPDDRAPRYQELAPRLPEGPIDLDAVLPGEAPLELDIGFGRGMSLLERAHRAPDVRLIGIEVKTKWAYKVARRLEREQLRHARAFAGDVREVLSRAGPVGCLTRAFVHFPDPWWKKRHAKRRVITEPLLEELARLLADGGELFVQTDVPERAESYRELLRAHSAFELAGQDGFVEENPYGARSNRERRAEEDGLPVHRLLARRVPR